MIIYCVEEIQSEISKIEKQKLFLKKFELPLQITDNQVQVLQKHLECQSSILFYIDTKRNAYTNQLTSASLESFEVVMDKALDAPKFTDNDLADLFANVEDSVRAIREIRD